MRCSTRKRRRSSARACDAPRRRAHHPTTTRAALFSRDALERYELELLVQWSTTACKRSNAGDGIVRADLVPLVRRILLRISAAIVGLDEVADASDSRLEAALDGINVGVQSQWATEGREAQLEIGLRAKEDLVTHYLNHARHARADMLDRIADETLDEADAPRDLLMLLLRRQREDPSLTDDTIVRECILYLVASVDTSVNAVTHVLTELESWLERHPADRQRLADPEFLRLATEETLRLHPPSPATIREAAADLMVGRTCGSSRAKEAMCDFASSNTDASIFGTAPERFNPHREIPNRVPRYGHSLGPATMSASAGRFRSRRSQAGDDGERRPDSKRALRCGRRTRSGCTFAARRLAQ